MMDYLQQILNEVTFQIPTTGTIVCAILACILLVFSGYASGSEIAFFSLSPNDLNDLDEDKNDADKVIKELRADSERTLATILITNNLVNVTIIMLCNYVISHVVDFGNAYWLQFIVITVLLTFLLLLFGEIMPKVYATGLCHTACSGLLPFFRPGHQTAPRGVLSPVVRAYPFWYSGREGGAEGEPRAECRRSGTGA